MGGAAAWWLRGNTLPAAPGPALSPTLPSPRAGLVLAGGSWPPEVGEAGVLPPASHPDLVPVEVWHGFGLRRFLLTRRPPFVAAVPAVGAGLAPLW